MPVFALALALSLSAAPVDAGVTALTWDERRWAALWELPSVQLSVQLLVLRWA